MNGTILFCCCCSFHTIPNQKGIKTVNPFRYNNFDFLSYFYFFQFPSNSVTVPGYQGNLQAAITHTSTLAAWERFGVEMILTFIVVLAYMMSTDSYKSYFGVSSLSIGAAYSACSFVSVCISYKFLCNVSKDNVLLAQAESGFLFLRIPQGKTIRSIVDDNARNIDNKMTQNIFLIKQLLSRLVECRCE